ncbi:Progestin and adipoQ receptor family member 4-like [Oopsacas minuta]|uniref:Progestin and adipoQ receptor family member 4-like n=1 Tax=Oopsacas minuta TaxID=111878 RepID=A0AAV7JTZ0_9METZ|nr:Progestin and adipoQ receptor family member 4-like [Oopsacas minuta]
MQNIRGLTSITAQPSYLQFNRYIRYGYRPVCSTMSCIKSLLYLHNESVNIYSHVIAFIYFFSCIFQPGVDLDDPTSMTLYIIFWQGSCLPFLLSVTYHLFMCHNSGFTTYNTLLRFDIFGIYWVACFGIIPAIYIPLIYFPTLANTLIIIHLILSFYLLWKTLYSDTKVERIIGLAIQYIYRILFHSLRLFAWSGGANNSFWYLIQAECIFAAGALINVSNASEKNLPINGKIIYFINSHTLMHYASIAGIYLSLEGLKMDLDWINSE